jgi:hypothetical protein
VYEDLAHQLPADLQTFPVKKVISQSCHIKPPSFGIL